MTNDVIELRLPPQLQYLPVLRATTRAIAGGMSFNYDEIIQLQVAVSEAFELAIKFVTLQEQLSEVGELVVRFQVGPDKIEILIPAPEHYAYESQPDSEEEQESQALIKSLIDELELGTGAGEKLMIRMVKYKPGGAS